jgi:primosomal protein N' (replication factor Y)
VTVDVVLPLPLDQSFSYLVPQAMRAEVQVGARVLVPFRNRRLTGVVVEEGPPADEHPGDYALKPVYDVLDDEPALPKGLLQLTHWIHRYYVCSWGEAIKAALPAGTTIKTERRLAPTEATETALHANGAPADENAEDWSDHPTGRTVLQDLAERGETTLRALRRRTGETVPLALVRRMARDGVLDLETQLSDPSVQAKTAYHVRFAPAFRHDGVAADLKEQLRGSKQRAVVEVLAGLAAENVYEPRQADVKARADAPHSTMQSLADKGIIEVVEKEVRRSPLDDLPAPGDPPDYDFHPAQQAAVDAITGAVDDRRYESFLLHGVTGSGKTVVYIEALRRVLDQGRTGIVLVPEIALTPQTVQRFRAHFGDRVAVLHSQMSDGERFDMWRGIREGQYPVVIGPRSAILAPVEDLGLVVVDEEHESSYKQFDPAPRYHARDVAVMRAHQAGAACVLGSATPSLESLMNARWGKYTLLEMPERVPVADGGVAQLPDIEIIDLTLQRKKHQLDGVLADPLRAAIQTRLDRSEQVILLQNRRGYAPVIECEDCGWVPRCTDCAVSLTYHKAKGHLRCHYCGRTARFPRTCPDCGSDALSQIGTGTQRVEEELADVVPDATVLRMDRDTTTEKHAHHRILERFRQGAADILLGTQMVAKGLDFGRVTLVGVVDADVGLLLPDFRAEERTFQLLTQVAGRAGRADLPGEVLLQTRNPDQSALQHAKRYDFEGFAEQALAERRALHYPPFGRVASVAFRGPEEDRVERLAERWTAALRRHAGSAEGTLDVLGPEPAFIARVKKQYRYRTILKSRQPSGMLQAALRQAQEAYGAPPNGYHIAIDVDALGLM